MVKRLLNILRNSDLYPRFGSEGDFGNVLNTTNSAKPPGLLVSPDCNFFSIGTKKKSYIYPLL